MTLVTLALPGGSFLLGQDPDFRFCFGSSVQMLVCVTGSLMEEEDAWILKSRTKVNYFKLDH